jgi:hypothetical protein
MSWEKEDALRRKVREARERQVFTKSIETVLSAKDAQNALLTQRDGDQQLARQNKIQVERERQGRLRTESSKGHSNTIHHARDGRPERER